MIKIIRYHPQENNGEPRIYSIPKRQTQFRIDLYVKLPSREEADRRIVNIVDKMTIHDVHAVAIEQLAEIVRDGELCEDAWFEVWAA